MTYEEALLELDARLGRWLQDYPSPPDHFMIVEWWKKQAATALAMASELTKQYIGDHPNEEKWPEFDSSEGV